jgi:dihydroorotase
MPRSVLIRHGLAVLPDGARPADLGLEDGRIARVADPGEALDPGAFDRVVDATGLTVLPGAIDVHVHFRTPGGEHKEDWDTGSRAALAGGVTTVLDMPNTDPPTTSAGALDAKRDLVGERARVNYGFFLGATAENAEAVARVENVAGLKIYMGSSTGGLLVADPDRLERIFAAYPGRIAVHAEDEQIIRAGSLAHHTATDATVHARIRNVTSARRATERAISLARRHGRGVHICHLSTREEMELVRAAADPRITCEVAPHHLVLTEDALAEMGNLAKMNPPLRTRNDNEALWAALAAGDVACVASDHAPHTLAEKAASYWEAPAGVPGVQHLLPILLDAAHWGRLSLERVAEVTAAGPARLFGIRGKGRIAEGMDADLTLCALGIARKVERADVLSKCGWTPYEGMTLHGWPVATLLGGEVVYDRGAFPVTVRGTEVRFEGEGGPP